MTASATNSRTPVLADHTADWRMLMLAGGALVIGGCGALGAWVLLKLIALATNLFWFGRLAVDPVSIGQNRLGLGVVIVPVAGSVIVGLMARFGSDKIRGHGIPEAIEAILYGESRLSLKVALLKPLSSAISIGSGGPFGAEGPIIMTGGAIGSLIAQLFHLSAAERKVLLVSGAAAGMTAIFGTPVAAILLAVEVLLFEWKPRSFVPVTVAVLVAALCRPWLIGSGPLFPFAGATPQGTLMLPLALGVGIAVGLLAVALSAALYRIEDGFHRLPLHWMWWPALGAVVVGLGGLIDPRVLGAGYANIFDLLDGAQAVRAVLLLLVVKALVWLVALGSGTSGGVLAPLLILGGALGSLIGTVLPGGSGLWAMVGMAAIMSGAMRAPLTGALFAVELTGHAGALPLVMAASAGAYGLSVLVMRRSILTEKIARRGRHIVQEYGVDSHDLLQARQIMTRDPATMRGDLSVEAALAVFAGANSYRSYPVVDREGALLGLVSRSDALRWQVNGAPEDASLAELLSDAEQPSALLDAPIGAVADLIIATGVGRIPVVDPATRRVVGIVSRHDLLKGRRAQTQTEHLRTR